MTTTSAPRQTVLRRRSWPVLCGIAIAGLGAGMTAAILKVTSVNGFQTGWQGIPVFLALAGLLGRIAACKVVLGEDTLVVINPLRTHTLPKPHVQGAAVDDHGTLELRLDENRSLPVFAFGGSLVDRVKGTSDKAAHRITAWLNTPGPATTAQPAPRTRWTRAAYADACLALCAVTAGTGALWMALSGGA